MEIVLASTSPYRKQLLDAAGICVETRDSAVDESQIEHPDPVQTAVLRARAKAEAVKSCLETSAWVIGADQVVHLDGIRFDKPKSAARHENTLQRLRGRRHELATAVTIIGPETISFVERSYLLMRADLSDAEISDYVATGEGRYCAGGYQVETKGIQLFSQIEGCWTNILGLPIPALVTALRSFGWRG